LPIEHTKLMKAMNGPTTTFSRSVRSPCPDRKYRAVRRSRYRDGEETGDEVTDDEFAPQHGQV